MMVTDKTKNMATARGVAVSRNVTLATTVAEKEEIYRLRYQVYIEEMGGGSRHSEADASLRQLRDDLDDKAYHFYVRQQGEIVACVRHNLRSDGPFECEDFFAMERFAPAYPDRVSMTSRLVVHPKLRSSIVLRELACAGFEFGIRHTDIRFDFIDCHPRLIPIYTRLGYRIYDPGFRHPKYVYVIPMVLVVHDVEYLNKINSPFVPFVSGLPGSTDDRDLLLSQFPDAHHGGAMAELEESEFWHMVLARLVDQAASAQSLGFFNNLNAAEMKLLLSLGNLVRCRAGDPVLMRGDPGREIFIIVDGSFRVGEAGGEDANVKKLVVGDMFGEIAFLTNGLRSAPVIATENSSLLILNARALDHLGAVDSKLAAKLFRNMATIVASRMRDTLHV
jgi:hypothetical protein